MAKITLDGREIEVKDGSTILEAALEHGAEVPHFCYHPGLSIAGNCRMCLVEVEGMPKLVIGCYTRVNDGMVVNTKVDKVKEAQEAVMEFLLVNHPLDCSICDQAGECKLQDHAVEYGTGKSRFVEKKLNASKAVDIGEHIMLDQERCIQCSRCTRFCDEITETSELDFFQRGSKTVIGLHPGKRLDNNYSGNTADICPVGALTLKEFRFSTRVWYLNQTPTICAGCARGCNVVAATGKQNELFTTPGQFDDRIKRIVPRHNDAVNGHWMCDEGRLSYLRLEEGERLKEATDGNNTMEWEAAAAQVAQILSGHRTGFVLSPRLTCEELHAWNALAQKYSNSMVGVQELRSGEDDSILIRADKGANSEGARLIVGSKSANDVLAAAGRGELDALIVVGDPLDAAGLPAIDAATRSQLKQLIYVGAFEWSTVNPTLSIPMAAWSEMDGHFVNFEGHLQRVARARKPQGFARPSWQFASAVAQAADSPFPRWTKADEVLLSLGEENSSFAVDPNEIGLLGLPVGAPAVAGP